MCVFILDKFTLVRLRETVQIKLILNREYNNYYQNVNNTLNSTETCHTCVLVTCFRTYISVCVIGLQMENFGFEPLLLACMDKTVNLILS